jgi:hypothetical protein
VQLPFTHDQFLDLFGDYTRALWPFLLVLWLATAWILWQLFRNSLRSPAVVPWLLAIHWAWSGAVYQLIYFRRINPAATLFGAAFLTQALLLLWRGVFQSRLTFSKPSRWSAVGWGLILYSMLYPAVGLLLGLRPPRWPSFGVPCPTTVLTAGLLLLGPRREARLLGSIPVLWAAVGSFAAFALGIRADVALGVAGVLLLAYMLTPSARLHHAS